MPPVVTIRCSASPWRVDCTITQRCVCRPSDRTTCSSPPEVSPLSVKINIEPAVETPAESGFASLGLSETTLSAVTKAGYETPSPIQAATIPLLLEGRDLLGQAQTGTGKTAAFALPLIDRLDISQHDPQVMVLTPTRELAIQVAEAFQGYAAGKHGFRVLPVYGGQPHDAQVRSLKRGVHVIVGTPGRVMDHMRRRTLKLGSLKTLVLDEADEMLNMGFLEDVTWILEQTPQDRQIALFSATMPRAIQRIAQQHLNNPGEVRITTRSAAAGTIRQRHQVVPYMQKLDALTRLLEVEPVDGMLIFVRTKTATVELTEKLEARGYAAAALSGDIPQPLRERTVERFKSGKLDFIVATDVAARGLDVDRISHVLNYDIPHGPEAYVHRIGRTGRAGRTGDAILFVTPREKHMLGAIERNIGQRIEMMTVPTTDEVNRRRIERFKQRMTEVIEKQDTAFFERLIEEFVAETEVTPLQAAAALAVLVQGSQPLLLAEPPKREHKPRQERPERSDRSGPAKMRYGKPARGAPSGERQSASKRQIDFRLDPGTQLYRVEVGSRHGVKPGQIMGAIANEGGLEGKQIGRISINYDHSLVGLPEVISEDSLKSIGNARVCGQRLRVSKEGVGRNVPKPDRPEGQPGSPSASSPEGPSESPSENKGPPSNS
ncbi:MAG: ATP-dependent RNA helicase DeaD [Pseudohongiellaceae bacterium]|jgi:ATP-dependent RNA helicase DeaD